MDFENRKITAVDMLLIGRKIAKESGKSPSATNALARNLANDAVLLYSGLGSPVTMAQKFAQKDDDLIPERYLMPRYQ